MSRTLVFLKAGLFLALAAGCSAVVAPGSSGTGNGSGSGGGGTPSGGTGPATGTGGGGTGSTPGTAGTGGGVTTPPGTGGTIGTPATACPTVDVTRTPLRRLTRFEYANTVRDLLGVDTAPANELPVDEVTDGFNNNAGVLTVSSLHAEKYVLVSETLAKAAVRNLATLTGCAAGATEDACAQSFARSFGRRAFRRPTTAMDEQLLMAAYSAGKTGGTHAEGIEVMIRAALQSPHFLYRFETTTPASASTKLVPLSSFELATRLSYLIWASGPDDALLDVAARGALATKADVAAKAKEMLNSPKARVAITDFYSQWIGTSRLDITTKSATAFPAYSAAARDAMARELPAFVEYVLWSGDHKFSTLLTSPVAFVSAPLAAIYGVTAPAGGATTPQMVTLPAAQNRAGILTQAGFLSVQAHPDQTSPVLRGKFVRARLMCQPPMPPPDNANITPPAVTSGATARDRAAIHEMAGASCRGCHALMDPIGLAFENFDAIGQYRVTEGGKTIDASGMIAGTTDPSLLGAFTGVRELAGKLAGSDLVRDCLAKQWFHFAAGRHDGPADACSLATLADTFATSGGDLVELVVGMTQTDAFWYRAPFTP